MSIEVKVPMLPESVADATIAAWHKKIGEPVKRDENLVDLETDKVVLEVPAPSDGILKEICFKEGETVTANQILAHIDPSSDSTSEPEKDAQQKKQTSKKQAAAPSTPALTQTVEAQPSPVALQHDVTAPGVNAIDAQQNRKDAVSPSVRRLLAEYNLKTTDIHTGGKEGRVTKEEVFSYIANQRAEKPNPLNDPSLLQREEKRVPMTRLRATIAQRLLQAQHNAAILTTFNEVNLNAIMNLRNQYKAQFEKTHGVKLGFMSFFTKAVVDALKRFPAVNASIDGQDIIYHGYYDISIAVSTERGLVVPVLKNVDQMTMADIEKTIANFANRAREGKLSIEEMQGGTFTITNGGVFGSLLATPIINPPQTAILGMHKIEERPIAEKGQVVIRPMMYIALSYDHRLIDGKDSVQFLIAIKELLEDPTRFLLNI